MSTERAGNTNDPCGTAEAQGTFPDEAFRRLAAVEDSHFWFRARNRLIVWALEEYFAHATSLLEVGCGTGVALGAIHRARPAMTLVGADLSAEAVRVASERVPATFVCADARNVDYQDEFDVACAFDTLEHIEEDELVLARLAAAARRGGGVLVTVPQHRWLWSSADDYGGHVRRYTKGEIEAKIASANLSVIRSTAWMFTLLPVMALSRLRDRRAGATYNPDREVRLPGWLNRSFEVVLDLELRGIARGLTFPVGGTRLVVARKT